MADVLGLTVEKVTDYILENDLREGDALPATDVMVDMLSVSRVTYREAMLYLRGLGVITSKRGSCFRIAKFNPTRVFNTALPLYMMSSENLDETAKLRSILEVGVVADVALRATDELKNALDDVLNSIEELLERDTATLSEYEMREVRFHSLISEASGCELLNSIMSALFKYIYKTPETPITEEVKKSLSLTHIEHRLIADAIRLNDSDTALMAMKNHLRCNSLLGQFG